MAYLVGTVQVAAFVAAFVFGLLLRRWYDAFPTALALTVAVPLTALGLHVAGGSIGGTWLEQDAKIGDFVFWFARGVEFGVLSAVMLAAYGLGALIAYAGAVRSIVAGIVLAALTVGALFLDYKVRPDDGLSYEEQEARSREIRAAEHKAQDALLGLFASDIATATANETSRCFTQPAAPIDVGVPSSSASVGASDVKVLRAVPAAFAELPSIAFAPSEARDGDRLLTPVEAIRSPDAARYVQSGNGAVVLTVVVGDQGQVLAAVAVEGPEELYAAAVAKAMRWRFVPYLFEGRPIAVRVEKVHVPIYAPDKPITRRVAFPDIGDRARLRIYLEQRNNFDGSYAITIRGDGAVRYQGFARAALLGEHCAKITPEAVDRIIAALRACDFFSLDDRYVRPIEDIRYVSTSALAISIEGRVTSVIEQNGIHAHLPAVMARLQNFVDDSVDVRRWTHGNDRTGESLLAERWNFQSSDPENRAMLARVAERGSARAVADLLRLGAPRGTGAPALRHASRRRDFEMIGALLASNIGWSKADLNFALVEAAAMGNNAFVTALLSRGADPNASEEGQTALLGAAEGGVPATVAALLAAGADIKRRSPDGETALHKAGPHYIASYSPDVRFEASGANRGEVVRMLVRAGIPIESRDNSERTPLNYNYTGYPDVTAALIELGADVNTQDHRGATPLMWNRNAKATALLLAAGANPFLADIHGVSALQQWTEMVAPDAQATEIRDVLVQWLAAHPKEANQMRAEAKRIGTSRIPKAAERIVEEITPASEGMIAPTIALFGVLVPIQMLIVFALTRVLSVRFGRAP